MASLRSFVPKTAVIFEAPPPNRRGADLDTDTMKALFLAIKSARAGLANAKIEELPLWLDFRNVWDEPLPVDNPHVDWASKRHQERIKKVVRDLPNGWVVFSNRPWQALKAAYGLKFNDIEFCKFHDIELKEDGHEPKTIRAAWIWHSAESIKSLWKPDEKEVGLFLWDEGIEGWRNMLYEVGRRFTNEPEFDFPKWIWDAMTPEQAIHWRDCKEEVRTRRPVSTAVTNRGVVAE